MRPIRGQYDQHQHGDEFSFVPFKLLEPLHRWDMANDVPFTAQAQPIGWDIENAEWYEREEPAVAVYGDFWRGYGFADDLIRAYFDPYSGRWQAHGCGHFFVRGKIGTGGGGEPTELQSGGTAPLKVWHWDEDLDVWAVSDPLVTITIREAVGLDAPLATDELCFAEWHEQGQFWIASLAPCPEES